MVGKGGTHLRIAVLRLRSSEAQLGPLPLPVRRCNLVPFPTAHPPQLVQVLPVFSPQLFHRPRPAVLPVLRRSLHELVATLEERVQPMIGVDLDLRKLLARLGQRLVRHGDWLAEPRPPERADASEAVVVSCLAVPVSRA